MARDDGTYKLFYYHPSIEASILFVILFILTTALHVCQSIRTRTSFVIPVIIGGFFEIIGHLGRTIASAQYPDYTLGPYIIQSLLLLLAPNLFAATVYMSFGRLVRLVGGEELLLIRAQWVTKIFVTGDVLSFLIQAGGGGIMASGSSSSMSNGSHIVVGGLVLQLLSFGTFVFLAIHFERKIHLCPTRQSISPDNKRWHVHLIALYLLSAFIIARAIYRVIEFSQGMEGYLMEHEWVLFVFDAMLMWLVMLLWNITYPGEIKSLLHGQRMVGKGWTVKVLRAVSNSEKDISSGV